MDSASELHDKILCHVEVYSCLAFATKNTRPNTLVTYFLKYTCAHTYIHAQFLLFLIFLNFALMYGDISFNKVNK